MYTRQWQFINFLACGAVVWKNFESTGISYSWIFISLLEMLPLCTMLIALQPRVQKADLWRTSAMGLNGLLALWMALVIMVIFFFMDEHDWLILPVVLICLIQAVTILNVAVLLWRYS